MSVTLKGENRDSPELTGATAAKTSVVRRFTVISDDIGDGPKVVTGCEGLDSRGNFYTYDNDGTTLFLMCVNLTAKRTGVGLNKFVWIVEIDYETPDQQQQQDQQEDPFLELPTATMHTESETVPMLGWIDGDGNFNAWTNSANQVFKNPPQKTRSTIALTIEQNFPIDYDVMGFALLYVDHINQDTFWAAPAGVVLCKSITGKGCQLKLSDDTYFDYLRVTFVFSFCNEEGDAGEKGWNTTQLDYGDWYLDDNDPPNKVSFKTDDGKHTTGFLDGSTGAKSDTPVFLPPRPKYDGALFQPIGLPQSFGECKLTLRAPK